MVSHEILCTQPILSGSDIFIYLCSDLCNHDKKETGSERVRWKGLEGGDIGEAGGKIGKVQVI